MSSADILEDSFPHGTPAGFDRGCQSGGLCANKGTDDMTCKEAKARYASDLTFRRHLDAGGMWIGRGPVPAALKTAVIVDTATPPRPAPSNFETFKKPSAVVPDALREKLAAPDFPHGTNGGYQRGCKAAVEFLCPGDDDGRTCAQANRDYKANYEANKRTQQAKTALQNAGVPAADLDQAAVGAVALATAGTVTAVDAAEGLTQLATGGLDLTDYTQTEAPDVAVDALVETLDDTKQRLADAQAQVASLEEENERLLRLTGMQTDTIIGLREKVAEAERIIAADRAAAEAAASDSRTLNEEIEQLQQRLLDSLRTELAAPTPVVAEIMAPPVTYAPQSDDRVNLSLDPQQAANVILALAGGGR